MNDLRTIVAVAIAIALSFPDGSSKGCVALSVANGETAATEISVPTAEVETRYDNPLEEMILRAITIARSILVNTEVQFAQYKDKVLSFLAAIEAPFVQPSTNNAADDTSRNRRRRWTDPLADLSFGLSEVPNLLGDLAVSIPTAIVHPFEFATNLTSAVEGLAIDGAETAALSGFNYLWRFLTTQGLPWLRTTLDKLDRNTALPPSIHDFIKRFDTAYDVVKTLGFI
ncbi:uncharacterized protein LOC143216127 [Lasioglossum baleicum]|uniref:uncharacterized protein LOC143216127 n=1 Tax=Lasioglossum baleicum TaxID=434251 RepID=UPI003FCC6979